MRARIGIVALAVAALGALPAAHAGEVGNTPPQGPAHVGFGPGFPKLTDHEWGFQIGGFGGIQPGYPLHHVPVIFVHGNNVDAADWYPVQDDFRAAGWTDQELWALSFNGLGANNGTALFTSNPRRDAEHQQMGWDGQARVTADEENVPDLYDFIKAVQAYTGSAKFTIIGHSLGVTLARRVLRVHPELRADLVAFVGIAGANHGTSLCPPGTESTVHSCDEIAAGTQWLADLNGPNGSDETYGPAKWLTVFDGSGVGDPAYAGPTYAQSPALAGAVNSTYPRTYHNDLRVQADIVADYRRFVEQAEVGALSLSGAAGGASTSTGSGAARPVEPAAPPGGVLAATS
jgi:pimeloyl-ACP methyl ester carboxylesterase